MYIIWPNGQNIIEYSVAINFVTTQKCNIVATKIEIFEKKYNQW